MQVGNVKVDHVRGFGDKVFGLGKEVVGTVINNDRLQKDGEAQQARGTEAIKALRKRAEAQAKEAKADAFEQRQQTAQRSRRSA
jgi:uncharacterized protein YjbJ (UPF0337 family)